MTALLWTLRYEALMAARRKAVWGAVLPLALLSLLLAATSPVVTGHHDPAARAARPRCSSTPSARSAWASRSPTGCAAASKRAA
ncbi:hypothetical protein O1L68_39665 [Streptomyces lydicus]|nr:hypothetical protein [Streptomyces lydicus]